MHLHSVIVSYDRPTLTRKTLESYLATVAVPHSLVIVDNGSGEETQDWLLTCDVPVVLLGENRYPGFATNRGWELAPEQTTLLHRSDNDILYLPGWSDGLEAAFSDSALGQVGLTAEGDTRKATWPIGGNTIIRREVFDEVRYSEEPWGHNRTEAQEFWRAVRDAGWSTGWLPPGIDYLWTDDPDYYRRTHEERGVRWQPVAGRAYED